MTIVFNIPCITGNEEQYIKKVLNNKKLSGDGEFNKRCCEWLENNLNCLKAFLTPSCTHALELAAMLIDIKPGDEVIMPSYTFVSTANAFVLRGAKIIFVDINPKTMNINEKLIEQAITEQTKAIVPVHYAGIACEMDSIMQLAEKYNLFVIEDAAQALTCTYKNCNLGTIGHLGCFSFHETKNFNCGEGGAIIINDNTFIPKAEIIREKGTNRVLFFSGEVDKYTWQDQGSSYLMSELNAAFLYGQLEMKDKINSKRLELWNIYYSELKALKNYIDIPYVPKDCQHNAHIFYIKVKNLSERIDLIQYFRNNNIYPVFHYIPLHNTTAGSRYANFVGEDVYTTKESERIIRLPLYYELQKNEVYRVVSLIKSFFIR